MKKLILTLFLFSCQKGIEIAPVSGFELEKYLGKWYEIARTDNSFEKGCTNVTAEYTLQSHGLIKVLNTCDKNGKIKQAKGVAKFAKTADIGLLKVSFFRPFYGTYNIVYLSKDYKEAIIYGGKPKYIWILARSQKLEDAKLNQLLAKIKDFGLDEKTLLIQ